MKYRHISSVLLAFCMTAAAVSAPAVEIHLDKNNTSKRKAKAVNADTVTVDKTDMYFSSSLSLFGLSLLVYSAGADAVSLLPLASGINKLYLSRFTGKYADDMEDYSRFWSHYLAYMKIICGAGGYLSRESMDDASIQSHPSAFDTGCVLFAASGIMDILIIRANPDNLRSRIHGCLYAGTGNIGYNIRIPFN